MIVKRTTFYDGFLSLFDSRLRAYRNARTRLAKSRLDRAMILDFKKEVALLGSETYTKGDAEKEWNLIKAAAEAKGLLRLWLAMKLLPNYLDD